MVRSAVTCIVVGLSLCVLAAAETVKMDFEDPAQMEQWLPESDHWAIEDGVLRQSDYMQRGTVCFLPRAFSDVTVEVRFFIHKAGRGVRAPGVVYRAADDGTYYYVHYDHKNSQVVWVRNEPGRGWRADNTHRHPNTPISVGEWHTARVEVEGDTHRIYLDGKLLFEQKDDVIPAGVVGLRAGQGDISFDDLRVEGTPVELEEEF
ncbi:MAG: DUF1080 domain-containing protein, partial [Armatimonadetes bacterium]|nr:DUF1080 domain-containing protein [Armatimonadota bacterium]